MAQVFWTNNKAKESKTNAISVNFRNSIETCSNGRALVSRFFLRPLTLVFPPILTTHVSTFYEGRVFSRRVDRKWYFSRLFGRALVSRPFRDVTRLFFLPFNLQVKQEENEAALLLLSKRLKELDALPWEQRQISLIEGIIAGNVFDWGAKEVSK